MVTVVIIGTSFIVQVIYMNFIYKVILFIGAFWGFV